MLVEDDLGDVAIIKKVLKELDIKNETINPNNGEEALDYLSNEANERPCIIFLDLNMPKMNGTEFLNNIKADQRLKNIPVIALTTSKDGRDIEKCFQLGVAGYTVKPVDYKQFVKAIAIINLYWMLNEMPGECERSIKIDDLVVSI
jgi:CheY-like chemotaxis protein